VPLCGPVYLFAHIHAEHATQVHGPRHTRPRACAVVPHPQLRSYAKPLTHKTASLALSQPSAVSTVSSYTRYSRQSPSTTHTHTHTDTHTHTHAHTHTDTRTNTHKINTTPYHSHTQATLT
jgi:hypothetical protein